MRITLIDDSVPFDGYTPSSQPLGAAEKAFASLAGALARVGHEVRAYSRCKFPVQAEAVNWTPIGQGEPGECDMLIAHRKPSLLTAIDNPEYRVLIAAAPPAYLLKPKARAALLTMRPHLVFYSRQQADDIHPSTFDSIAELPRLVMAPAARPSFRGERPEKQPDAPVVTVAAHPRSGLTEILKLWIHRIAPQAPTARLKVFSSMINKALLGGEYDEDIADCVAFARLGEEEARVSVHRPMGDADMADEFLSARLHLHAGQPGDMLALGVHEAQAAGVPVVAFPGGATDERLADGETGYIAPDDDAFVNLVTMLIADDNMHASASAAARNRSRKRTWDDAARELVDHAVSR
jgi:glycosyltransferase involved in cell wall biosynthesis